MKDIVKIQGEAGGFTSKELFVGGAKQLSAVLVGYIASKAVVLDKLLPFGLSFLAGSSSAFTPAAALGAFVGYFIPAVGNGGFRYIAALFALLAIKLLLGNYKRLLGNIFFKSFISGTVCLATAAVSFSGSEVGLLELITEALLCAGGAYFTAEAFRITARSATGLSALELSELLIFISIILSGLSGVNINGISFGRIAGVLLILIASKYGGGFSGAVSGIATALSFSLGGNSSSIALSLAVAGLASGIFARYGRYAQTAALVISAFIGAMASADAVLISRTIVETALGSATFLALPRGAGIYFNKVFSAKPAVACSDGLKKTLIMRLELASNALRDVSQTVDRVSGELAKINAPSFNTVLSAVEQDACSGCKLRVHCWETKREDTVNAVLEMTGAVKQGNFSPEANVPEEFKGRCFRLSAVANAAYRRYSDYASRIAAENRIDEVRSVVSDQFNGISAMLYDLSLDFAQDERFDTAAAENAAAALKYLDIRAAEASCRIDRFGRMTAEFKVKKTNDLIINRLAVMKAVSVACERDFDPPTVSEIGGEIFMTLNEHASLTVDVGVRQISALDSGMCGDAYKYFSDGRGHFVAVLSDGMGTGGRAAVDGAMASGLMSRLIKAGFGYDCALKILNSAMLFKSTDESSATVDIASIDLYSGRLCLYKAGAAPTVLRRSGKTGKAESTSLPAGILREIGFDTASVKCKAGDVVVLMSDGAAAAGTDWIRDEIENVSDTTAQQLAERLCEGAKRRHSDTRRDDITVLALIINKAAS